ncbi:DUF2958 domain-containing protein [Mesorhizobium waimense]|uniref:DUF2958 domain-containing protein n=1 Tax=Mesorhizobium waimense TaxID=1300307 RepID=A0A3A5K7C6_9HYPH|nr:DUF2958 domain-containing protein [Mesorhizobium waimense]
MFSTGPIERLSELKEMRGSMHLPIERDLHFRPNKSLSACAEEAAVSGMSLPNGCEKAPLQRRLLILKLHQKVPSGKSSYESRSLASLDTLPLRMASSVARRKMGKCFCTAASRSAGR